MEIVCNSSAAIKFGLGSSRFSSCQLCTCVPAQTFLFQKWSRQAVDRLQLPILICQKWLPSPRCVTFVQEAYSWTYHQVFWRMPFIDFPRHLVLSCLWTCHRPENACHCFQTIHDMRHAVARSAAQVVWSFVEGEFFHIYCCKWGRRWDSWWNWCWNRW